MPFAPVFRSEGLKIRTVRSLLATLLVLFAVPTLFILLMSLALRDAFRPAAQLELPVRIVDEDGGRLATRFVVLFTEYGSFRTASEADVSIVLLPGFSELLATRNEIAEVLRAAAERARAMKPAGGKPNRR